MCKGIHNAIALTKEKRIEEKEKRRYIVEYMRIYLCLFVCLFVFFVFF